MVGASVLCNQDFSVLGIRFYLTENQAVDIEESIIKGLNRHLDWVGIGSTVILKPHEGLLYSKEELDGTVRVRNISDNTDECDYIIKSYLGVKG